jgi:hypothetical protein
VAFGVDLEVLPRVGSGGGAGTASGATMTGVPFGKPFCAVTFCANAFCAAATTIVLSSTATTTALLTRKTPAL